MSAFVCDDKTINRIVGGLRHALQHGDYNRPFCKPENELILVTDENAAEFGRTLYLMNLNAVEQRYPDCIGNPNRLPGQIDESGNHQPYRYQFATPQRIQFLKSLSCYLYQCTEGDVDELPLYRALRQYQSALALHIVEGSKEYENAEWG